ncbi:trypsin-3-like isoform X1 [Centruroides vittatus]|uniref:trypsin-3-like isoform X1 n=2 Tax=Centruroides vittatus TaxID=120091 RepID=UPI00350F393E
MAEFLRIAIILGLFPLGINTSNINFRNDTEFDVQPPFEDRVVGGEEGKVPSMAAVYFFGNFYCGGSIISRRWVVSAAHCFDNFPVPWAYFVKVGSRNLNSENSVRINVMEIHIHPKYVNAEISSNDIALLKLQKNIVCNNSTKFIRLNTHRIDLNGKMAEVAGWGELMQDSNKYPHMLRVASLPIIPNPKCEESYRSNGLYVTIHDSQLCAGYKEGGKDSCQGDSGGPLYIEEDRIGAILVGIVSYGYGCAIANFPGVYTRVSSYISWIDNTVLEGNCITKANCYMQ